ncbi:MAG: ankyrin repeat domain-containing protein [Thermoanaerobaculia bacterium]|nr:ankyrin repeat domain-containing protein [Thermoanaerobaculia bacterium]
MTPEEESRSTPVITAVKSGDRATLIQILDEGADVNQQDFHGWTPLNWAAGRGDVEAVSLLLDRGADPARVGTDERTAYQIAIAAAREDVARLLVKRGAAPESGADRPYCRAYEVDALRAFEGWPEEKAHSRENGDQATQSEDIALDDVVFLHQDLTVTRSAWHGEDVLFDRVDDAWREFCRRELEFEVPDDFDLLPAAE